MVMFYGFLTRSKKDGTIIARASTNLVFLNKVYRAKKVGNTQEVSEYSWTKCKYIPVPQKAFELRLLIVDHYIRRVEKSGIKDLVELDKKQILTMNNPYYEIIVESLKKADYLPCTEEEKQKFNPLDSDFVTALKMIEHFDRTPEEQLKEQLYVAYKELVNDEHDGRREFVKDWVKDHPETENYPEYKKIKSGDLGMTPEKFALEVLSGGVYQ